MAIRCPVIEPYPASMLIQRLWRLLEAVRVAGSSSFSGVGILVSTAPEGLPVMPLRAAARLPDRGSALDLLVSISKPSHDLHDGFHLFSPALELLLPSVYFSPPVVPDLIFDPGRRVGGRYWAALFGSALPNVLAAGVASSNYGVALFEQGREVNAAE